MSDEIITFIVPTVGRDTLHRAITSIKEQTNPNWRAIICFDRVKPFIEQTDKISVLQFTQSIHSWRAGAVRNFAIASATTPYIGFLDDDDSITPDYLDRLVEVKDEADIVIMQMQFQSKEKVLPRAANEIFTMNRVGISFAVRTDVFKTIRFRHQKCEDVFFLREAKTKKMRIKFHPHIVYRVRH